MRSDSYSKVVPQAHVSNSRATIRAILVVVLILGAVFVTLTTLFVSYSSRTSAPLIKGAHAIADPFAANLVSGNTTAAYSALDNVAKMSTSPTQMFKSTNTFLSNYRPLGGAPTTVRSSFGWGSGPMSAKIDYSIPCRNGSVVLHVILVQQGPWRITGYYWQRI